MVAFDVDVKSLVAFPRCEVQQAACFAKSTNVETKAASYDSASVSRTTGVVWLSLNSLSVQGGSRFRE